MRALTVRFLQQQYFQRHKALSASLHSITRLQSGVHKVRRQIEKERGLSVNASGMKFCRDCGHSMTDTVPSGDSRSRLVCLRCGYIDYRNPKLVASIQQMEACQWLQVVGCIVEHEDRILLCSRGIQPCRGLWTLPAGYLEIGESMASGAARETMEEANAVVSVISMFSMMDVPIIGQCHVMFRATLNAPFYHSPGQETLQTKLIIPEEISLHEVAFTSMRETIKAYWMDRRYGSFRFHHGVIVRRPEASPSDPEGYTLQDYVVQ